MNTDPNKPTSQFRFRWWLIILALLAVGLTWFNLTEEFGPGKEGQLVSSYHDGNIPSSISSGGIGYSSTQTTNTIQLVLHFYRIAPEPEEYQKQQFGIATSLRKDQSITEDYGIKLFVFGDTTTTTTLDYVEQAVEMGLKQFPKANYMTLKDLRWFTQVEGWGIGVTSMQPLSTKEEVSE